MSRPLTALCWTVAAWTFLSGCRHAAFLAGIIEPEGEDRAVLTSPAGETTRLGGALAGELARVPGAMVRVQGKYRGWGERRRLEVSSYRLLDAGKGVPPHVGRLFWDGTRLLLIEDHGEGVVELRGRVVGELRKQTGARVWIVGPVVDIEVLEVFDYGVLKAPS